MGLVWSRSAIVAKCRPGDTTILRHEEGDESQPGIDPTLYSQTGRV